MSISQAPTTTRSALPEERRRAHHALLPRLGLLAGVALLVAACGFAYRATQHIVYVEINGVPFAHRTHQRSAEGVLREMAIVLGDADRIEAPTEAALIAGEPLQISLSRQVRILHDGWVTCGQSLADTVGGVIEEMGVLCSPDDHILMGDHECTVDSRLPLPAPKERSSPAALLEEAREPLRLSIRRAVSFSLQDGPLRSNLHTTAHTVGEALYESGLTLYEADQVVPDLDAPITPGLVVRIERSRAVTLDVGGQKTALRSMAPTVEALLEEQGLVLGPKDYVLPSLSSPLEVEQKVSVVRVHDEYYVQEIPIGFEVRYQPDPELEIDQRQVASWGREGAMRKRMRVHYENDKQVYETKEEAWIAQEPVDRVINYGTKIVLRKLETPEGTVTYWRKLRVLATSYNAPTAGKPFDHPTYGITRLGWRASKGIIAVDPRVVNLRQPVYVPDYGLAVAGDTGGAIKWRRIDLCFDDDNLELWYRWVDLYLLPPVPDRDEIRWMIPNWPQERH